MGRARVERVILAAWVAVAAAAPAEAQVWFAGAQPSAAFTEALGVLAAAREQGLDPADYDAPGLAGRAAAAATDADRAIVGEAVEAAVHRYLADLSLGRVAGRTAGMLGELPTRAADLEASLRALAAGDDLRRIAASVEPRYPSYRRLAAALARWRERHAGPQPPDVPAAPEVKAGSAWDGAAPLRARLAWLGDVPVYAVGAAAEGNADRAVTDGSADGAPTGKGPVAPAAAPLRYDTELVEAVKRFQARHGIAADGALGKPTLAALNASPARRVRQIELAMERLRWLPDPGRRLVYVEVPRAMLWALDLERGGEDLTMRLVVGEAREHATPMLASRITGVVFRPYWVPTKEIVREEILPRERAKPGWLAAHGMEIVASGAEDAASLAPDAENLAAVEQGRLTVRQRPGPRNDLGPVKFVVPNPACIALHGTPNRRLFDRPRRDRSHGCVRLEDPTSLAEWVLHGQDGWGRARIEAAMKRARPTGVRLREPVSLAVAYATASVDPDGTEHFLEDIYGLDAALERELAGRRAASR